MAGINFINEQEYSRPLKVKSCGYTLLGVVKCPNNCQQGKTKHYLDNKKALYDLVNCKFCKGKGTVSGSELKSIEQSI